jgi:hypothetical protein
MFLSDRAKGFEAGFSADFGIGGSRPADLNGLPGRTESWRLLCHQMPPNGCAGIEWERGSAEF